MNAGIARPTRRSKPNFTEDGSLSDDGAVHPIDSRARTRWWALPVVPVQAVWLTRTIARFGVADGTEGSVGTGPRRMCVVALGDSVCAGYALPHHRVSVAGQLADRFAQRYDATVEWRVRAVSGFTAAQAMGLVSPDVLADADLVFVSVGVNDLKAAHTTTRFRRDLGALLDAVLGAAPHARVCLLGIPPLEHFPAFPHPLADVLGWRGRAFDAIGVELVRARERALRIQASGPLEAAMFGPDGFHPSETLHAAFADAVMAALDEPRD